MPERMDGVLGPRLARVIETRRADDVWGVTTVETSGPAFRSEPCRRCPWRRDAPVGAFPAEVFRLSARTAYDLATHTFGCHASPAGQAQTCAGFLLRGADHNLTVRMWRVDLAGVRSKVPLYDSYREMAIANGVHPNDSALRPCRDGGGDG